REHLRNLARHCPIPIFWAGRQLEAEPEADADTAFRRLSFSEGGFTGSVELSPQCARESLVDFVTFGVTVSAERLNLPAVQVAGIVRNDAFRKSLSQTGILRDDLYKSAVELLQRSSQKLLLRTLAEASLSAESVGQALDDPALRREWMRWEERSLPEALAQTVLEPLASDPGEAGRAKAALIERFSLTAFCARAACLARADALKGGDPDPALQALWRAPLLFDLRSRPLSLMDLEEQRRWLGLVPFCDDWDQQPVANLLVARVAIPSDRSFLEAFFGKDAKPMKAAAAAAAPPVMPELDEPNLLLKLPFKSALATGEIGLSLVPHTRASRIRWLRDRRPLAVSAWPLGGLRLEAVVECPSLKSVPQVGAPDAAAAECLSELMTAAPAVYRRLAELYDPRAETPRQAILREHLLDLAAVSWDPGGARWRANDWLDDLKLLRDAGGRMLSMRELREGAARGEKVFLAHSVHPEALQELTAGYPDHGRLLLGGTKLILGIAPPPRPRGPVEPEPAPHPRPPIEPAKPPAARPPAPERANTPPPPAYLADISPSTPRGGSRVGARAPGASAERTDSQDPAAPLRAILRALAASKGCPLPEEEIAALGFGSRPDAGILYRDQSWMLNAAHPMIQLLASRGAADENAAFLVSILYTALNRASPRFTDDDDLKFQMALADLLLEGAPPDDGGAGRTA
ncbi:MAG TPA: hypothetical protein VNI01_14890, partial [Elusimicrobiota bacterium]|nr:hypothetical protein [Elusimicrobiota bacterium]